MQLTLEIPDNKLPFFMELVHNLGFIKLEKNPEMSPLTKRQMELADIEVQKAKDNPESLLDFEEAWKTLELDS